MSEVLEQLETLEGRDWLAMQYVLDELPSDQRTAFEDAMLDDVSLCELVVELTRLSAGVTLACAADAKIARPRVERRTISSQVSVLMAGIALAAFLIVAAQSRFAVVNQSVSQDDSETAAAFVNFLPEDEVSIPPVDLADEADSLDSLADLVAPEWLLTAVELENGDSSESSVDDANVF